MTVGISLTTYGDYSCTLLGGGLTFLGMVTATIKASQRIEEELTLTRLQTIATNRLMTDEKLKLHPLELLLRVCPLAAIQTLCCAYFAGEFAVLRGLMHEDGLSECLRLVLMNACLAFLQNLSSFHTNKLAGALTMAICANVKQFCTVVLAMRIFETRLSTGGAFGILIVLSATSCYSYVVVTGHGKDRATKTRCLDATSLEGKGIKH